MNQLPFALTRGEAINFMRRHQVLSPTHLPHSQVHKKNYRQLFALPLSLGKILGGEEILNFYAYASKLSQLPFALSRPGNRKATLTTLTGMLPSQVHHKSIESFLHYQSSLGKIRAERQSLILCVGIKVVTTTICPLPHRKQKDHAHHSHPHASLTSAHKSIESFLCTTTLAGRDTGGDYNP